MEALIAHKKVVRGFLGVTIQDFSDPVAESLGYKDVKEMSDTMKDLRKHAGITFDISQTVDEIDTRTVVMFKMLVKLTEHLERPSLLQKMWKKLRNWGGRVCKLLV
jgi:hypothetical protein